MYKNKNILRLNIFQWIYVVNVKEIIVIHKKFKFTSNLYVKIRPAT